MFVFKIISCDCLGILFGTYVFYLLIGKDFEPKEGRKGKRKRERREKEREKKKKKGDKTIEERRGGEVREGKRGKQIQLFVSTLFLNKSPLQLGLPCYQFFLYIVGFYSIICCQKYMNMYVL